MKISPAMIEFVTDTMVSIAGVDLSEKFAKQTVKRSINRLRYTYYNKLPEVYSDATEVNHANCMKFFFECYYGDRDPNTLSFSADFNSARSNIPYIKGMTRTHIFNLFMKHYGIRGPVIFRYSVIGADKVYHTNQFVMGPNAVTLIDDPAITHNADVPDNAMVFVEAFHPYIITPAGQLRFFGLYENRATGSLATVHSTVINLSPLMLSKPVGNRAFGQIGQKYSYTSILGRVKSTPGKADWESDLAHLNVSDPIIDGFILQEDETGRLTGIWHDDTGNHFTKPVDSKTELGPLMTTFFVPDFEANAPLLLIAPSQIGFAPNEISITLLDGCGSEVASLSVPVEDAPYSTIDTKELFMGQGISGPITANIDYGIDAGNFSKNLPCFVHVYYRSKDGLSDQVHSQHTIGYWTDFKRTPKSYRALKWAPFFKMENYQYHLSLVNSGGTGKNKDSNVVLRVFTDTNKEFLINKDIKPDSTLNLNSADILNEIGEDSLDCTAVITIEHETSNYNGWWFLMDNESKRVAVDHVTGG